MSDARTANHAMSPQRGASCAWRERVHALRPIVISLFLVAVAAGHVQGQAPGSMDPLAPVANGALICRTIKAGAGDSAAVTLEFGDGSPSAGVRQALVAFDSSGVPVYLVVSAEDPRFAGGVKHQVLGARFQPHPLGRITTTVVPTSAVGPDTSALVRAPVSPMTNTEIERARQLAEWYWQRRCGRRPTTNSSPSSM